MIESAAAGNSRPSFFGGLTVKARLITLGGLLGVMLAVVAVVAITGFTSIKSAYNADQLPGNQVDTASTAYEGWLQADDQSNMFAALAALHDPKQANLMAATWKQVTAGRNIAKKALTELEGEPMPAATAATLKHVIGDLQTYDGYVQKMFSTISSISKGTKSPARINTLTRRAVKYITVDNANISNASQADFNKLRSEFSSREGTIGARIPATTHNRLTLSIVIGAVALLLALGLTVLIILSILRPLRKVGDAADKVALGDVDVDIDVHGRDEISKVAASFRSVIDHLRASSEATLRFAGGRFEGEIEPRSEADVLSKALKELQGRLVEALGTHSRSEQLQQGMGDLLESMQDLNAGVSAMAAGNLTVEAHSTLQPIAADEEGHQIGFVAERYNEMIESSQRSIQAYNEMREKVAAMIAEITQNSESLSAASSEMASTSEEAGRAIAEIANAVNSVAQGAEQQVRSVDDVRRVTDELAEASRLSSEAADETSAAAEQARALAHDGVVAADNATAAMQSVRESSTAASAAIKSLGEKSDEIGGIVATITGIAAQTNLLALNAAIEAARAGEYGRGFAVVAEEVRQLAEESKQAAASIGALIEEIQHETARAVEVVQNGTDQTRDGVGTVEQARDAFVQIGQSIEDMSSRVEQIAASIRQIAASGDHVRDSMNEVAAVAEESSASTQQVSASTEQSSASTQQIAASAQQLANTADELEKLVSQFTLA